MKKLFGDLQQPHKRASTANDDNIFCIKPVKFIKKRTPEKAKNIQEVTKI